MLKEYSHSIFRSPDNLILSNNLAQKITNKDVLSFLNTFNPLFKLNPGQISTIVKSKILELLLLLESKECLDFFRLQGGLNRGAKITLITDLDISESITLNEMARRLGLSLSTFKREFKKKIFKEPAKQWLIKKKIESVLPFDDFIQKYKGDLY